jgi:cobalt-zinc-cadmium efflux system membrane fusion protein
MYLYNIHKSALCRVGKVSHYSRSVIPTGKAVMGILMAAMLSISAPTFAKVDHEESAQHGHGETEEHKHDESEDHSDSTDISDEQIALSNIQTERVSRHTLNIKKTLFGLVSTPQDKTFRVFSSYESLVKKVHVSEGQNVIKGQLLLTLFNKQNLQTYTISSPSNGEVTKRFVNTGDHADENVLLEIIDLSQVWIELSAFPKDIDLLSKNQVVWVYDMHQHKRSKGKIIYVAPIMTNGHIARARVLLNNNNNHWRPGMHIKADVIINQAIIPLAVKTSALQILDGNTVVFTKHGNKFESSPVITGKSDDTYTQIMSGLQSGAEYVSVNSFVIKADIKKDGASHSH